MRMKSKYVSVQIASARSVADRWASQYQHPVDGWRDQGRKKTYDDIAALGENPAIDSVAEIIGNKSWSHIYCDGCGSYVERAVSIGEYEPKAYCKTCIDEAQYALASHEAQS